MIQLIDWREKCSNENQKLKLHLIFHSFQKKKNIKKFLFKILMFLLLQIFIIETVHWTTAERYG